jgi:23S rRNA (uridine2552-2'-O)-methyltransferase
MGPRARGGKVNRAWLHEHLTDPYVKLARKEGYRARAAYKLREIDESLHLIRPGQVVVDLGSTPGAWSQYVRRRFAARADAPAATVSGAAGGTLIALDVLPMEPIEGVGFVQGDFSDERVLNELVRRLEGRSVDLVLSDMAPNLSGVAASDAARMSHLVELALGFALAHLRPDGALVAKVFHGSGYSQLVEQFKRSFRSVKAVKPKASRDKSSETFLVGRGPRAVA